MSNERTAREERAWQAGQAFAKKHPFSEFANDRDSERLYRAAARVGAGMLFDIFKYGAQAVWRERGEL